MDFHGILFFPVTPFNPDGALAHETLAAHVETGIANGAGAVFPACGTGEYHALSAAEAAAVTRTVTTTVAGRVPVIAGSGGVLGHAIEVGQAAAAAGADALLVLPPYLVSGTQDGLVRYVERIAEAAELPVIVYRRGSALYSVDTMRRLASNPAVVGFKDGVAISARRSRSCVRFTRSDGATSHSSTVCSPRS
ncbi:hypothetical protein GCM10023171_25700 [Microbacterium panaciterrae]|uniref:5-dehydro-4-deoxyglucarate dehydratase n=1 Tax=Microbacterium panaciterrae TaxID=985759 RepID=A0ABP8PKW4_9MICO